MEVTQTKAEGLSRTFAVKVSASELQSKLDARIEEIRPTMNLKGFRPGFSLRSSSCMSMIKPVVTTGSRDDFDWLERIDERWRKGDDTRGTGTARGL